MNKKGVEMSVNTIIVIVIVLLILLIMAFLLTGGFQNFGKSTSCDSKGSEYTCTTGSCDGGRVPTSWSCPDKQVCCGPSIYPTN